jgi:hypothetical protein
MDPISLIVTALTAGAAAALKPTAERAVKDAYDALKTIIRDRYQRVATTVDTLESQPDSRPRREIVEEELAASDAVMDSDVLARAQSVLQVVQDLAPDIADEVAIDLEQIRVGASVNIKDVVAAGRAIRIRDADVGEDLNITGIRADARRSGGGS